MPSPISAADLTSARADVESLMVETVNIRRPTNSKSATGASKRALSSPGTSSICRKRDLQSTEQETASELEPVKLTEFLLPYNADVRTDDVLEHSEGKFEVVSAPEKRSTLVQQRVLAKKAAAL